MRVQNSIVSSSADRTKGSTHYHTVAVKPPWAKYKEPIITIGNHLFYKGIESVVAKLRSAQIDAAIAKAALAALES